MQKQEVKGRIRRILTLLLAVICVSVLALPMAAAQGENGAVLPGVPGQEESVAPEETVLPEETAAPSEEGTDEEGEDPEEEVEPFVPEAANAEVFLEYYVLIRACF